MTTTSTGQPTDVVATEATAATGVSTFWRAPRLTKKKRLNDRRALKWALRLPALAILVLAVIGPWLTPYDPITVVAPSGLSPSGDHWFGTDPNGYDVFSRTMDAFRIDVMIGVFAALLASVAGIGFGLLTGMNESKPGLLGYLARTLSRVIDLLQAVPALIIGMVAAALYGTSQTSLTLIMAVVMFPLQARLVRTETLRVRREPYIDAARMAGFREFGLTVRHVLPNASWPAFEYAPILFGSSLVLTAGLGFLGVGVKAPTAEWGTMLAAGASDAAVGRWWGFVFPGLALVLSVVAASALFSGRDKSHS
jgi:peptide/nickel transport system permease protein